MSGIRLRADGSVCDAWGECEALFPLDRYVGDLITGPGADAAELQIARALSRGQRACVELELVASSAIYPVVIDVLAGPEGTTAAAVTVRDPKWLALSPRQRQICQMLRMSRERIAGRLGISVSTLESHIGRIKRTVGVAHVSELRLWAYRNAG